VAQAVAGTDYLAEIADDAVTNAKLANMADSTIKGQIVGGSGDPVDLTAAQARAVQGLATTDKPELLGVTLTGGTVTSSVPLVSGTQTWNNGAVAFEADSQTITPTASANTSTLIKRVATGAGSFQVLADTGEILLGSAGSLATRTGNGPAINGAGSLHAGSRNGTFYCGDITAFGGTCRIDGTQVKVPSGNVFAFSSTTASFGSTDLAMRRNAAGVLEINNGTSGQFRDVVIRTLLLDKTITAPATTGAQTINKSSGSVNFAAAATSLVVTNSLVTTSSVIMATVGTNDATMFAVQAVAGSGSFTLYANAAATAETRVNFFITN